MCECCGEVKDIYLPQPATVKAAKMMNETELYLQLSMDAEPLVYQAGQFVEVSVPGFGESPISISSSPTKKDGFELVVRRIGNVTNMIHKLTPGDKIGIRGPFGQGCYPVEEARGKDLDQDIGRQAYGKGNQGGGALGRVDCIEGPAFKQHGDDRFGDDGECNRAGQAEQHDQFHCAALAVVGALLVTSLDLA